MTTVTDRQLRCKLTLTNALTGARYQVERLPRKPGDYRKGFRLTGLDGAPVFAHELPCGLQECSCSAWIDGRGSPSVRNRIHDAMARRRPWVRPGTGLDQHVGNLTSSPMNRAGDLVLALPDTP